MAQSLGKLKFLSRLVQSLIAFALTFPFALSVASAAPDELVDSAAPDFALRSVADGNVRLSEFRSNVVVLNFWSGWCGPCGQVLPALNNLQTQHQSAGLQVIAVDVKGDP